jgi:hypothetical protein
MAKNSAANKSAGPKGKGGNGTGSSKRYDPSKDGTRAHVQTERRLSEARRQGERQTGTLYERTNTGRSTDIVAACRGVVGDYAYPGGSLPSVHFNVQQEVGEKGPVAVIRFESVHKDHPLSGAVFDPKVHLLAFFVNMHGQRFKSRAKNPLMAKTQNLICHNMAAWLEEHYSSQPEVVEEVVDEPEAVQEAQAPETLEEAYGRLPHNKEARKALVRGVPGVYALRDDRGIVIIEVYGNIKPRMKVVDSSVEGVPATTTYVPVTCLRDQELSRVTSPDIFTEQVSIFTYVKKTCAQQIEGLIAELSQGQTRWYATQVTQPKTEKVAEAALAQPVITTPSPEPVAVTDALKRSFADEVRDLGLVARRLTADRLEDATVSTALYFMDGNDGTRSYFTRSTVAGVDKIALRQSNAGGKFQELLKHHPDGIVVDVLAVIRGPSQSVFDTDMTTLWVAREHLVRTLHEALGFTKQETPQADRPAIIPMDYGT